MRAASVVYCTNRYGYSGHLRASKLKRAHPPFKGTMTVQGPGTTVSNQGKSVSWGFHFSLTYDPETQRHGYGLDYLGQSAKMGYLYFGGENTSMDETVSADDTFVASHSVAHLRSVLLRFFGKEDTAPWKLVSSWSGIMGFSSDGLPWFGSSRQL